MVHEAVEHDDTKILYTIYALSCTPVIAVFFCSPNSSASGDNQHKVVGIKCYTPSASTRPLITPRIALCSIYSHTHTHTHTQPLCYSLTLSCFSLLQMPPSSLKGLVPRRPCCQRHHIHHYKPSAVLPPLVTPHTWSSTPSPSVLQVRHATFIPRPRRPYQFTQLIALSDGSTYTVRSTSPQPVYRSVRDTRNHLLWQPTERSLQNIEHDEAGRLAAFRQRFGRGFDLERTEDEIRAEAERRRLLALDVDPSAVVEQGQQHEDEGEAEDEMDALSSLISGYADDVEVPKSEHVIIRNVAAKSKGKGKK